MTAPRTRQRGRLRAPRGSRAEQWIAWTAVLVFTGAALTGVFALGRILGDFWVLANALLQS